MGETGMKRNLAYTIVAFGIFLTLTGCTTNTNTNNAANTNRANSNSTLGNAANSVANAVSNAASAVTGTTDSDFLKEAGLGGMAEVEMGKLASTKAANAEVKKFAQMMVTDHSKANEELKALASRKGVTIPAELDSSHKATLDGLRSQVGADFDTEYVEAMVDDHEKDVKAFEDKAKNATDPDIKAFAEKTLPVLKKHLEAIKAIQSKMQ
jgi:putative membrane protein